MFKRWRKMKKSKEEKRFRQRCRAGGLSKNQKRPKGTRKK